MDSDEEFDPILHKKLIQNVLNLNKKTQIDKWSRTEPTLEVSEYGLVRSVTGRKGRVKLDKLTKTLSGDKRIKLPQKIVGTLEKPLEKPQAERIRRSTAFETVKNDLDKWEPIVTSNRAQPHISFPLPTGESVEKTTKTGRWRIKSELQKKLELLEPKIETYNIDLEKPKKRRPINMVEMLEQRENSAKMRAVQSYKEAKARRLNKIKSKKFHRIQRKENVKKQMKEFEALQKSDPEQALLKLEEIEKARAEERMNLRHKSTGQWARNKQIRAKYDRESRQALSQQLSISRELTQKLKRQHDSDDEEEQAEKLLSVAPKDYENNPWIGGVKPDKEVDDFIAGYKKFWEERSNTPSNNQEETVIKKKKTSKLISKESSTSSKKEKTKELTKNEPKIKKKKLKIQTEDIEETFDTIESQLNKKLQEKIDKIKGRQNGSKTKKVDKKPVKKSKKIDLNLHVEATRPVIDEELDENTGKETDGEIIDKNALLLGKMLQLEEKIKSVDIDPKNIVKVAPTKLHTEIPSLISGENDDDDDEEYTNMISEAFQDDDVVEDFKKDKKGEIDKDKPEDINLCLPGWGSWGGTGLKPSKRKKRRFIIKFPKKLPRKDDNKGALIINEKEGKIKSHLVSDLPFPFTKVSDFEASIRAPIGNTFVPETAFKKMIRPAVKTSLGAVIKPIDEDVLLKKKE